MCRGALSRVPPGVGEGETGQLVVPSVPVRVSLSTRPVGSGPLCPSRFLPPSHPGSHTGSRLRTGVPILDLLIHLLPSTFVEYLFTSPEGVGQWSPPTEPLRSTVETWRRVGSRRPGDPAGRVFSVERVRLRVKTSTVKGRNSSGCRGVTGDPERLSRTRTENPELQGKIGDGVPLWLSYPGYERGLVPGNVSVEGTGP